MAGLTGELNLLPVVKRSEICNVTGSPLAPIRTAKKITVVLRYVTYSASQVIRT